MLAVTTYIASYLFIGFVVWLVAASSQETQNQAEAPDGFWICLLGWPLFLLVVGSIAAWNRYIKKLPWKIRMMRTRRQRVAQAMDNTFEARL